MNVLEFQKQFSDLFNNKLLKNDSDEAEATRKIKEFKLCPSDNNENKYNVNWCDLEEILKSIENGKSKGFSDIVCEMIKYGINNELIEILTIIYTTII